MNAFSISTLDQRPQDPSNIPDAALPVLEAMSSDESEVEMFVTDVFGVDATQPGYSVPLADGTVAPAAELAAETTVVSAVTPSLVENGGDMTWERHFQHGVLFDAGVAGADGMAGPGAGAYLSSSALTFRITAEAIAKVSRLTRFKSKQAPDLEIEIGPDDLICTATTLKGDFTVACAVPLRDAVFGRRFRFRMAGDALARIGTLFEGLMIFVFDADDATLRWRAEKGSGSYATTVVPVGLAAPGDDRDADMALATLPVTALADAIGHASLFASEALRGRTPMDGLRIGEGSATSGYAHALVKYASPAIPDELAIVLPIRNAGNLRTVLAKLSGSVEIIATDTIVHLKTIETTISWTKDGRWPATMDKAFRLPVKGSYTIPTRDLQNAAMALSIATKQVEIRTEQSGDLGRLVLAGHSQSARGTTPLSPWSPLSELPIDAWTFSLSVADLLNSALTIQTDNTILDVADRGLYLRAEAPGFTATTFLLGTQLT